MGVLTVLRKIASSTASRAEFENDGFDHESGELEAVPRVFEEDMDPELFVKKKAASLVLLQHLREVRTTAVHNRFTTLEP